MVKWYKPHNIVCTKFLYYRWVNTSFTVNQWMFATTLTHTFLSYEERCRHVVIENLSADIYYSVKDDKVTMTNKADHNQNYLSVCVCVCVFWLVPWALIPRYTNQISAPLCAFGSRVLRSAQMCLRVCLCVRACTGTCMRTYTLEGAKSISTN